MLVKREAGAVGTRQSTLNPEAKLSKEEKEFLKFQILLEGRKNDLGVNGFEVRHNIATQPPNH